MFETIETPVIWDAIIAPISVIMTITRLPPALITAYIVHK